MVTVWPANEDRLAVSVAQPDETPSMPSGTTDEFDRLVGTLVPLTSRYA